MNNNEENNDNKLTLNIRDEDNNKRNNYLQSNEKNEEIEKVKNIMKYTDDEINTLSYELAK